MLQDIILLLAGFVFLIKGADFLVEGSVAVAKRLKVSTLIIGLTIVALGTSMPELLVNIMGAMSGSSEIPLGNIVGSNIANTLLVLGAASIIAPLVVKSSTVWREIPFNLLAVVVLLLLSWDLFLGPIDATILFAILIGFSFYVYRMAKGSHSSFEEEAELLSNNIKSYPISAGLIVLGLIGLYFGGDWIVTSASSIATSFGMSQFMISATIIAIGTSLPELVTAIVAARKGDIDLVVGNVVGSNILNVVFVLATTMAINPLALHSDIIKDLYFLVATTVALFVFVYIGPQKNEHAISRSEGLLLLLAYVGYMSFLVMRG